MYNEQQLYKKVNGHLTPSEIGILEALVKDVNEFNEKYCAPKVEVYIDFCDIDDGGEWNPYETFSIKFHTKKEMGLKYTPVLCSEMGLRELDNSLCTLLGYFEELDELK